ncbi:hypothetical protein ACOMHN_006770 [Nucella lapillus]
MTTRSERDRAKAQQEKFQAILSSLLKDEDNKYCEDCDAKAPRWASWNLGVFLCIRCAGIHRNLGVHISRVKSVNLDSWTGEQVVMMQEMGNSRARAVYEANVQDSFRRPQTDSALEAFIRAKYEQKKFIAKEWVPPKPVVPKEWLEDDKAEKKKMRSKPPSNITLTNMPPSSSHSSSSSSGGSSEARASARSAAASALAEQAKPPSQTPTPKPKSSSDDLLGLESEVPPTVVDGGSQGGDLLADIFGGSQASTPAQGQQNLMTTQQASTPAKGSAGQQNLMTTQQNGSAEPNLFESGSGEGQGEKKSAKDSIMALYGSSSSQQQMFGVPGYYFGQYTVARRDMTPNGEMMPPNPTIAASPFAPAAASNNPGIPPPTFNTAQGASTSGTVASNAGMVNPFSGMDSGAGHSGMMSSNTAMSSHTGMMAQGNQGIFSHTLSPNPGSAVTANSNFKSQTPGIFSGNASLNTTSKPVMFSAPSGVNLPLKSGPGFGGSEAMKLAQTMGLKTASAGMSSSIKSVAFHVGVMPSTKPQPSTLSPTVANNPFMYPGADFCQPYSPNMYYYPAAGGMYMPQQQMYGGMQPMVQPQPGMMGMQQGMMGQPVQQGMMGMQQQQPQQPGGMFSSGGQMGQNQMGGGNMMGGAQQGGSMIGGAPQGGNMMGGAQQGGSMMGGAPQGGSMMGGAQQGGSLMGGAPQGGMMGRPAGGQMFMGQQPQQQQMNPMQQQQMQFQQMQQQMANMTMGGGGGQMGGVPSQQAAVGGGSWGTAGTGQTLSTNLWQ